MKQSGKYFILVILIAVVQEVTLGQSLMSVITRSEKAVFSAEAYNSDQQVKDIATGFFISADGIAVTKASLFYKSDSVVIRTRNGKTFDVEEIISVHPYADLALIKVKTHRQKDFTYLQTYSNRLVVTQDVLILSHPDETERGITVEPVVGIDDFLFINRYGLIISSLGYKSFGAPVVNTRGILIGIYGNDDPELANIILSSQLLDDSLWVNVNIKAVRVNEFKDEQKYMIPYLNQGIRNLLSGKYVEAVKLFTIYLKYFPDSYNTYCLRALARYKYGNYAGGNEDIAHVKQMDPKGYLAYYIQGLYYLDNNKKKEAYKYMSHCLNRNPEFIPAKVEHARLEWKLNNKIRKAYDEFSEVIDLDSLSADSYYERARLSLQFSSNKDMAYEDLNRAIYLDPALPGVFSLRGTMRLSSKDFLGAINDFTKAIEYNDKDVHAFFNRGIAYFNIGMKKNACKDWQKAGELGNYSVYKYISRYCTKEVK